MPTEKSDRRSQRTRRLLGEALVTLLAEQTYEAITVQAIIDRADVGRTTFYDHFRDKDDLLFYEIGEVIAVLGQAAHDAGAAANPLLPSLALFRHVQTNHRLYQAMAWGREFEPLLKKLQGQLAAQLERRLAERVPAGGQPAVPLPIVANYVAGAFLTQLRWWMESKSAYSAEEIDALFWRLVTPSLESVL